MRSSILNFKILFLNKMAKSKKRNKKLNTDLKDTAVIDTAVLEPLKDIVISEDDSEGNHEDESYTMGDIKASDADYDDEDEEFKKAAKNLNSTSNDDEEAEWVEEEEYNTNDVDSFLDEEDYDLDNPDYDDTY